MTWILFYLLDNCKLLLMDVEIFEKLHSEPEIWPFEKLYRNPSLCVYFETKSKVPSYTVIARPQIVLVTWILFLQLMYGQMLILGTESAPKVPERVMIGP